MIFKNVSFIIGPQKYIYKSIYFLCLCLGIWWYNAYVFSLGLFFILICLQSNIYTLRTKQFNKKWYRCDILFERWGIGGYGKNQMLLDRGGGGLTSNWTSNLCFFILKKIWFALWPDIMLSQTFVLLIRNLLQWYHPFNDIIALFVG